MVDSSAALALAAGGARGAYQAGALLYLAEQGLRFHAVAGTSIGTLNGAYYVQGDGSPGHMHDLCVKWRKAPKHGLIRANPEFIAGTVAAVKHLAAGRNAIPLAQLAGLLASGGLTILDPQPVEQLLDSWLDYAKVCKSPVPLTLTVLQETNPVWDLLSGPARIASYLRARELGPQELRLALLAATAIPIVFPSRESCRGRGADAALADPLPARVLYQDGARRIFSIFLSDETPQNRFDFPDTVLHQVRPSVTIDIGFFSVFDFSAETIDRLIHLGYADAKTGQEDVQRLQKMITELWAMGEQNLAEAASFPNRRKPLRP